jgi:hypothetical protein
MTAALHREADWYIAQGLEVDVASQGRAWAWAVWRHLMPGSPLRGFSGSDLIRLLAHNLERAARPQYATLRPRHPGLSR